MQVHRDVYLQSDFGEPPQIAVWLENIESGAVRTVWVARRAGRRWWKGKVECPTALPLWESRHRNERSGFKARGLLKRFIDAITGATPTGGLFETRVHVPRSSRWTCFVEVNVSGDFNRDFPSQLDDGTPDTEVNGQPSLIYRGVIQADPEASGSAELAGRTDQWLPVNRMIEDLSGITSASEVVTNIRMQCSEIDGK
jgi:hypothetical protein